MPEQPNLLYCQYCVIKISAIFYVHYSKMSSSEERISFRSFVRSFGVFMLSMLSSYCQWYEITLQHIALIYSWLLNTDLWQQQPTRTYLMVCTHRALSNEIFPTHAHILRLFRFWWFIFFSFRPHSANIETGLLFHLRFFLFLLIFSVFFLCTESNENRHERVHFHSHLICLHSVGTVSFFNAMKKKTKQNNKQEKMPKFRY